MSRERRAYPRRPVRWSVTVAVDGRPDVEATIRDFCVGGMFVECAAGVAPSELPDRVMLRFDDPLTGGSRELVGDIARRADTGFGLAFPRPQPDLLLAFGAVADSQEQALGRGTGTSDAALAASVTTLCLKETEAFGERHFHDFASHLVDEFFDRARTASDSKHQSIYFQAFEQFRNRALDLGTDLLREWRSRLAAIEPQPDAGSCPGDELVASAPGELSLVSDRDFENWLSRSEAISRGLSGSRNNLEMLNRRLTHVYGRHLDEDSSPLGPAVLCECLANSIATTELDNDPTQTLFDLFGRMVLAHLNSLYERLNRVLEAHGILPGLEYERPEIRHLGADVRHDASGPAAPSTPLPDSGDDAIQLNWERRPGDAAPPGPTAAGSSPQRPSAGELLASHRALREHRQARAGASTLSAADAETAGVGGTAGSPLDTSDLIRIIDGLATTPTPAGIPGGAGLRQQLSEGVGGLERLEPRERDTVELLDDWFGDVGENALNTGFIREWSGPLAVLALRMQLQSGEFLETRERPIHKLINQLDQAGLALSAMPSQTVARLRHELDDILGGTISVAGERPEAVEEAVERIAALIATPLKSRSANMQKVLQQCEGSHKLERARRQVDQEIDKRMARRRVAKLLIEFVDEGWRNLLVLIRLRCGDRSGDWKRGLAVMDRLLAALGTEDQAHRPIPQAGKVLAFIERQFETYGRCTPEVEKVVIAIRHHVLAVCADAHATEPLPVARAPARIKNDEAAAARVGRRWLGQAKLLKAGDWVYFAGDSGSPEPLRLQWVSEDGSRFVFVNRSGFKARELTLVELAELLEASTAGVTEDQDQALTERQWQRKMREMHEELVRYATHDALTGLLNRAAFKRELERLPTAGGMHAPGHALVLMSLDEFKLVNGTLGDEAGNRILADIGSRLREVVGERGSVGRIGGDEFALLLRECSPSETELLVERECRRIRESRFGEQGNRVGVGVSAGIVGFSAGAQGADALLRDADDACMAAKQAGGNQMRIVRPDDRELTLLRSSMERAAQVDAALENNSLQLRAQLIAPLDDSRGQRAFYEVLVAMTGADDQPIPPGEFVPAAERFGRMPAVDRWVIRQVLEWCASRPAILAELAGITINLSGPTLNDAGFARYLREQFARTGVPGHHICFEVTETAAMHNLARAADLINEVKGLGCQFSLDDFGSGLSSYSYLKNLPVDYLKIDGQFVRGIDQDPSDHAMVRSINELGHFLGKLTIAEYVENEDILVQLRDIGLDYVQGFGIALPVPLSELS